MKNGTIKLAAAAILAGTMAVGCSKKDDSMPADKPMTPKSDAMATPTMSTPMAPATMPTMGDKMNSAMQSGADKMNAAGQSMGDKMHATTMPSMPSMTPGK